MKLWKYSLITTCVFFVMAASVTYTSCTVDSCEKLMCRNEGTCVDDFCRCPDGYEGTQCEITSATKFVGMYDGITKIDTFPVIIDSAAVDYSSVSGNDNTFVDAFIFSRPNDLITGKAVNNEVIVEDTPNKKVSFTMVANDRIEILIQEVIDGETKVTNFQGTKRKN